MFYNPVRKQVRNGMLSPVAIDRQQVLKAEGVQKTRGYSVRQDEAYVSQGSADRLYYTFATCHCRAVAAFMRSRVRRSR